MRPFVSAPGLLGRDFTKEYKTEIVELARWGGKSFIGTGPGLDTVPCRVRA